MKNEINMSTAVYEMLYLSHILIVVIWLFQKNNWTFKYECDFGWKIQLFLWLLSANSSSNIIRVLD